MDVYILIKITRNDHLLYNILMISLRPEKEQRNYEIR